MLGVRVLECSSSLLFPPGMAAASNSRGLAGQVLGPLAECSLMSGKKCGTEREKRQRKAKG